jgi:putative monooxygenase ydhR
MSQKILQINFNFSVPAAALAQAFAPLAQPIADTPGLRWKVWLMNGAERQGGGIYLFDDEPSVQAYLAGPIIGGLKTHTAVSDISVRIFGIAEEVSLVTRAPIRETVRA